MAVGGGQDGALGDQGAGAPGEVKRSLLNLRFVQGFFKIFCLLQKWPKTPQDSLQVRVNVPDYSMFD